MKSFILLLVTLFLLALSTPVYARSGCCSHHSGVCGCGCCDGTNLSATCRPYYDSVCGGSGSGSTYESFQSYVYAPPETPEQKDAKCDKKYPGTVYASWSDKCVCPN